jgi:hypothetical protein
MTAEELRKAMMNVAPKHSLESRVEWLEADVAAQRTAILKLERQVKHIRICGTIVAAVAGWLLGSALT